MALSQGHQIVPSEHAPRKDMVTDPIEEQVIIWEEDKTVTGAWIKADTEDLVEAKQ